MHFPRRARNSLLPEPMFVIYKITHRRSGKAYIGMTSRGIVRRLDEHRRAAARGDESPFYRALRKHGERAFDVAILAVCAIAEELLPLEISMMEKHRTLVRDGGYNILVETYSMAGWKHSPETRVRMSTASKKRMADPEARAKISRALTGRPKPTAGRREPWSEAQREQMRARVRGQSQEVKDRIKASQQTPEAAAKRRAGVAAFHEKRRAAEGLLWRI